MKRMLSDFKDELQSKYNYDNELAMTIVMIAESIVDYFGEEYDVVYDAISSCKYSIRKSPERKISSYSEIAGEFKSIPILETDGSNIFLKRIENTIELPSTFNHESKASLGLIANRTLALVRSRTKLDGDTLEERRGFEKRTCKLEIKDGEVVKSSEKCIGTGLENGVTSYSELSIMRYDYQHDYDIPKTSDLVRVAGVLMDGLKLRDIMLEAAVTGNYQELEKLVASNIEITLDEFFKVLDGMESLERERKNSLTDNHKLKEAKAKLDDYYAKEVAPLVRKLNVGLNQELNQSFTI